MHFRLEGKTPKVSAGSLQYDAFLAFVGYFEAKSHQKPLGSATRPKVACQIKR